MQNSNNLIDLIIKYEEYISRGNLLLKEKYNLEVSPLLAKNSGKIPKSGVIDSKRQISFNFHGMGCLFKFDMIIVDFDYSFGDFIYKGFSPIKLYQFIESYPEVDSSLKNEIIFNRTILQIELEGKIMRKPKNSRDTYQLTI